MPEIHLQSLVNKITTIEACHLPTFIFVGAGFSQSENYAADLQLPTAWTLREELLRAHFGTDDDAANLQDFERVFGIAMPTPDQVWQALIRTPAKVENYTERIFDLFNPSKPIPPSYYLLARWFFLQRANVCGFATTNFDLQLPQAFRNVASSLKVALDTNYAFASIPQDFSYIVSTKLPPEHVIQQLHGSLHRPWSIVAGAKSNITALSNLLFEYDQTSRSNPFALIRRFLDIVDTDNSLVAPVKFPPYEFLKHSLAKAYRIIFIGYSFKDAELVACLGSTITENNEVIVVDPSPKVEDWPPFLGRADVLRESGESFMKAYVRGLKMEAPLIMLPAPERTILRKGPQYIENYPKERRMTAQSPGETSSFLDPVYGPISFSPEIRSALVQVVDTGELQRLRQIKQLSFVNLKYHGATHDRFSHSLGVAYLADQAYQQIGARLGGSRDLHIAFTIAALIHDIGHGPYGHTMDLVRRELGDREGHEDDTGRIFKQIFNEEKSFADLDIALNGIAVSRNELRAILAGSHLLGKVLSNSGCDIDRLDFVMRDAAATLASIADKASDDVQDLELLVSTYLQVLQGIHFMREADTYILCFQGRVRPSLEAFARLYCKLYQKVYYGWQNVSARLMLSNAVVEMVRSQKVEFEDLKPLTDIELLATLEEFEHPRVRELAHLVKYRRLFRMVSDVSISRDDERAMFEVKDDQAVVEKFAKIGYVHGMLVARLPSKRVACRFLRESDLGPSSDGAFIRQECSDEVELGFTNARLMVFQPPR